MKLYQKILLSTFALLAAFGAGWLVNWWNSPLAPPFCAVTGASYAQQAVTRGIEYFAGWAVLMLIGVAIPSIPLWGMWIQQKRIADNRLGG